MLVFFAAGSQAATINGSFELSAAKYSVSEGTGKVDVTIKRVGGSTGAVTVQWRTNGVTAAYNQDYTSFSWTTLSFAAGQTQITRSITILDDKLVEPDETFTVALRNPTGGASLGAITTAEVTIQDNDGVTADVTAPTVAITSPASGVTYTSAQTVNIAASAQDNVGIAKVELYDGSTLVGTDTTAPYGFSWSITSAGNGAHSFTAKAYDAAGNSKVSAPVSLNVNIPVSTVTGPGSFELSASDYSVSEGAGKVDITIKRVGGSTGAATVQWRTNSATAVFNQDYTSFSWTTLSFADGQSEMTRSITILEDKLLETDETFNISLRNPTGGTKLGAVTSAVVTIKDNDAVAADGTAPTVAITSPASGTTYTSAQTVSIAASAQDNVGVAKVELYDGSTLVGTDTTAPYGFSLSIAAAGNGTHSLTAKAYDAAGNTKVSAPVSLNVNIPAPVVSGPGSFEFSLSNYSVDEGAGKADITIKRVGGNTGAATVEWRTTSVTATFNQDYTSFGWTTLAFAAGQSEMTRSIAILEDKLAEADETFNLSLRNPTGGASLGAITSAVVSIKDNDTAPTTGGTTAPADGTAPTVAITSPASGTTYASAQTVNVAASAQDNVGVSKVELYDGSTLVGTDTTAPYGFSLSITAAGNGTHTLTAKAYDAAGNSKVSTAVTVTVNIAQVVTSGPLRVFPGAEGFGTDSKAGRGGQVIKVTNLADSGTGSLRAALQASGPRIIVFEVSGYINLKSQISITNPYVTIAGQTAPSPGICLRNFGITIKSHDVLIQHLAIRPGNPTYVTDGLEILGPSSNIVIDHCSITWGTDENSSTWYDNVTNFTFSNNIIAEGLMGHSMGLLLGAGFDKASLVRNVFAHNNGRNPRIQRGRTHDAYVAMVNNLVYNHYWDAAAISSAYGDNDPVHINSLNNLVLDGPQTRPNEAIYGFDSTAGYTLYTSGDEHRPYQSIYPTGLLHTGSVSIKSSPDFSLSGYTVRKASEVLGLLKASAGSRPADRDRHDQRILDSIGNMNGKWISNPSEVGGFTVMSESYRTFNIPANPNGDDDGDGYTNIEEVLHQMSVQVSVK